MSRTFRGICLFGVLTFFAASGAFLCCPSSDSQGPNVAHVYKDSPWRKGTIVRHRLSGGRGLILSDKMDWYGERIYVATMGDAGIDGTIIQHIWWPIAEWESSDQVH